MDVLNLEEERRRLNNYIRWFNPPQHNEDIGIAAQGKLVQALEQLEQAATHIADLLDDNARIGLQLEQAREALDAIRMHPAVCNSFAGRQIIELAEQALKQQEVG